MEDRETKRATSHAPIFGLTGGVASGKSTVASWFREMGAHIIEADRLGHELMEPGQPAYQEVLGYFGAGMLAPDGRIDRRKLGPHVFADRQELHRLNAILHPRIVARALELSAEHWRNHPHSVVMVDAALIYEWDFERNLQSVIVAWCRPEQQLQRLMAKTGVSREEAERRIAAQLPVEEKRRRADYLVDCSGTLEKSRAQAEVIYPELVRMV